MKSDFDCISVNGIEKRSIWHLEFRKNRSDFAVWQRVQVGGKSAFLKRGSFGNKNSAAPEAHLVKLPPDSSQGRRKKNLALKDPAAPRYGRLGETDLGQKSAFFQSWTVRNLALRDYNLEVGGHSSTKSKPYCRLWICTMWFCAYLCMVVERELSSGGFRTMLSAP